MRGRRGGRSEAGRRDRVGGDECGGVKEWWKGRGGDRFTRRDEKEEEQALLTDLRRLVNAVAVDLAIKKNHERLEQYVHDLTKISTSQQQQLSQLQDLTAIPQVKEGGREEEDIEEGGRLFNVAVRGGR